MIQGFVDGDEAVIKQVNQRAWQSAIVLVVLLLFIVLMIWLLISFGSYLYSLVASVFWKLFESNDKFYFEDNGLRNTLAGGSREGDIEKVIENIIYNHLIRLGYEVTVGQLSKICHFDDSAGKPTGFWRYYPSASEAIPDWRTLIPY